VNSDEQWLADLLKRTVPQPPRQLTYGEITVPQRKEHSRKAWAMPVLAAAAVVAVGVALGATAARHSGSGTESFQPASSKVPASSAATPTTPPSCTGTVAGSGVTVPNVAGQQVAAAMQVLAQLGLEMQITTIQASAVRPGTVTRQNPAPGTIVPPGAKVMLYDSAGGDSVTPTSAPTTAGGSGCATAAPTPSGSPSTSAPGRVGVPSSTGMTATQAQQNLSAAGLRVVVMQAPPAGNEAIPAGTVWQQNPAAGTTVALGTTITIFVQPTA
jgi:PASTA domain